MECRRRGGSWCSSSTEKELHVFGCEFLDGNLSDILALARSSRGYVYAYLIVVHGAVDQRCLLFLEHNDTRFHGVFDD